MIKRAITKPNLAADKKLCVLLAQGILREQNQESLLTHQITQLEAKRRTHTDKISHLRSALGIAQPDTAQE